MSIQAVNARNQFKGNDSLHPAVLAAIGQVVEHSRRAGKPVSVCGEMAGDPAGALVLLGMGVDSLSMTPASLLKIKWVIRTVAFKQAQAWTAEALRMGSAGQIRRRLEDILEQHGLGALVRPGTARLE